MLQWQQCVQLVQGSKACANPVHLRKPLGMGVLCFHSPCFWENAGRGIKISLSRESTASAVVLGQLYRSFFIVVFVLSNV